jgi:hypothetical protein
MSVCLYRLFLIMHAHYFCIFCLLIVSVTMAANALAAAGVAPGAVPGAPAPAPAAPPAAPLKMDDFMEKATRGSFRLKFLATVQIQQAIEWPQRGFAVGCKNIRNMLWNHEMPSPPLAQGETYAQWAEKLGEQYVAATKLYGDEDFKGYAKAMRDLPLPLRLNAGVDLAEAYISISSFGLGVDFQIV